MITKVFCRFEYISSGSMQPDPIEEPKKQNNQVLNPTLFEKGITIDPFVKINAVDKDNYVQKEKKTQEIINEYLLISNFIEQNEIMNEVINFFQKLDVNKYKNSNETARILTNIKNSFFACIDTFQECIEYGHGHQENSLLQNLPESIFSSIHEYNVEDIEKGKGILNKIFSNSEEKDLIEDNKILSPNEIESLANEIDIEHSAKRNDILKNNQNITYLQCKYILSKKFLFKYILFNYPLNTECAFIRKNILLNLKLHNYNNFIYFQNILHYYNLFKVNKNKQDSSDKSPKQSFIEDIQKIVDDKKFNFTIGYFNSLHFKFTIYSNRYEFCGYSGLQTVNIKDKYTYFNYINLLNHQKKQIKKKKLVEDLAKKAQKVKEENTNNLSEQTYNNLIMHIENLETIAKDMITWDNHESSSNFQIKIISNNQLTYKYSDQIKNNYLVFNEKYLKRNIGIMKLGSFFSYFNQEVYIFNSFKRPEELIKTPYLIKNERLILDLFMDYAIVRFFEINNFFDTIYKNISMEIDTYDYTIKKWVIQYPQFKLEWFFYWDNSIIDTISEQANRIKDKLDFQPKSLNVTEEYDGTLDGLHKAFYKENSSQFNFTESLFKDDFFPSYVANPILKEINFNDDLSVFYLLIDHFKSNFISVPKDYLEEIENIIQNQNFTEEDFLDFFLKVLQDDSVVLNLDDFQMFIIFKFLFKKRFSNFKNSDILKGQNVMPILKFYNNKVKYFKDIISKKDKRIAEAIESLNQALNVKNDNIVDENIYNILRDIYKYYNFHKDFCINVPINEPGIDKTLNSLIYFIYYINKGNVKIKNIDDQNEDRIYNFSYYPIDENTIKLDNPLYTIDNRKTQYVFSRPDVKHGLNLWSIDFFEKIISNDFCQNKTDPNQTLFMDIKLVLKRLFTVKNRRISDSYISSPDYLYYALFFKNRINWSLASRKNYIAYYQYIKYFIKLFNLDFVLPVADKFFSKNFFNGDYKKHYLTRLNNYEQIFDGKNALEEEYVKFGNIYAQILMTKANFIKNYIYNYEEKNYNYDFMTSPNLHKIYEDADSEVDATQKFLYKSITKNVFGYSSCQLLCIEDSLLYFFLNTINEKSPIYKKLKDNNQLDNLLYLMKLYEAVYIGALEKMKKDELNININFKGLSYKIQEIDIVKEFTKEIFYNQEKSSKFFNYITKEFAIYIKNLAVSRLEFVNILNYLDLFNKVFRINDKMYIYNINALNEDIIIEGGVVNSSYSHIILLKQYELYKNRKMKEFNTYCDFNFYLLSKLLNNNNPNGMMSFFEVFNSKDLMENHINIMHNVIEIIKSFRPVPGISNFFKLNTKLSLNILPEENDTINDIEESIVKSKIKSDPNEESENLSQSKIQKKVEETAKKKIKKKFFESTNIERILNKVSGTVHLMLDKASSHRLKLNKKYENLQILYDLGITNLDILCMNLSEELMNKIKNNNPMYSGFIQNIKLIGLKNAFIQNSFKKNNISNEIKTFLDKNALLLNDYITSLQIEYVNNLMDISIPKILVYLLNGSTIEKLMALKNEENANLIEQIIEIIQNLLTNLQKDLTSGSIGDSKDILEEIEVSFNNNIIEEILKAKLQIGSMAHIIEPQIKPNIDKYKTKIMDFLKSWQDKYKLKMLNNFKKNQKSKIEIEEDLKNKIQIFTTEHEELNKISKEFFCIQTNNPFLELIQTTSKEKALNYLQIQIIEDIKNEKIISKNLMPKLESLTKKVDLNIEFDNDSLNAVLSDFNIPEDERNNIKNLSKQSEKAFKIIEKFKDAISSKLVEADDINILHLKAFKIILYGLKRLLYQDQNESNVTYLLNDKDFIESQINIIKNPTAYNDIHINYIKKIHAPISENISKNFKCKEVDEQANYVSELMEQNQKILKYSVFNRILSFLKETNMNQDNYLIIKNYLFKNINYITDTHGAKLQIKKQINTGILNNLIENSNLEGIKECIRNNKNKDITFFLEIKQKWNLSNLKFKILQNGKTKYQISLKGEFFEKNGTPKYTINSGRITYNQSEKDIAENDIAFYKSTVLSLFFNSIVKSKNYNFLNSDDNKLFNIWINRDIEDEKPLKENDLLKTCIENKWIIPDINEFNKYLKILKEESALSSDSIEDQENKLKEIENKNKAMKDLIKIFRVSSKEEVLNLMKTLLKKYSLEVKDMDLENIYNLFKKDPELSPVYNTFSDYNNSTGQYENQIIEMIKDSRRDTNFTLINEPLLNLLEQIKTNGLEKTLESTYFLSFLSNLLQNENIGIKNAFFSLEVLNNLDTNLTKNLANLSTEIKQSINKISYFNTYAIKPASKISFSGYKTFILYKKFNILSFVDKILESLDSDNAINSSHYKFFEWLLKSEEAKEAIEDYSYINDILQNDEKKSYIQHLISIEEKDKEITKFLANIKEKKNIKNQKNHIIKFIPILKYIIIKKLFNTKDSKDILSINTDCFKFLTKFLNSSYSYAKNQINQNQIQNISDFWKTFFQRLMNNNTIKNLCLKFISTKINHAFPEKNYTNVSFQEFSSLLNSGSILSLINESLSSYCIGELASGEEASTANISFLPSVAAFPGKHTTAGDLCKNSNKYDQIMNSKIITRAILITMLVVLSLFFFMIIKVIKAFKTQIIDKTESKEIQYGSNRFLKKIFKTRKL
jgi:hypothetical protein